MKGLLAACAVAAFAGSSAAVTINVGNLPTDGTEVILSGFQGAQELNYFNFSLLGDVNNGDGTYLNIQTYLPAGQSDTVDTEIGLYDSAGMLIASDDDGNIDDPGYVLYSLLTFGDGDPYPLDTGMSPGEDGTLAAGDYTLVLGGFNTLWTANIADITPGSSEGYTSVQFASYVRGDGPIIPLPSAAGMGLLGLGLVGLKRRR